MGIAHPQEGGPVGVGQVAAVLADAKEAVFVKRVVSAIRMDIDLPTLVMKTFVCRL